MPIYGYIRVSDEKQAKSGLGLAAQKKRIEEYARRIKGSKLAQILADKAVSASRKPLLERVRGRELHQLIRTGDHVVVAKLDRAFRNLQDFANVMAAWKKRGVFVHLIDLGVDTSTPVGELVAGIMASVAQWESRRIGERIKEAQAIARGMGRSTNGRATIGHALRGKKLLPDPSQRKTMRLIHQLRAEKRLSFPAIADELNRRKVHRLPGLAQRKGEGQTWRGNAVWRAYFRERELRGKVRLDQPKQRRRQCSA